MSIAATEPSTDQATGLVSRLIDWFVPDTATGIQEQRRIRLGIVSCLALILLAVPLAALDYQMEGTISLTVLTFLVGIPLTLLNALWLRQGGATRLVGTILTLELVASLTLMSWFNGGIVSASVIWMVPVPLIAQLLVGPRFGFTVALILAIELAAFFMAHRAGVRLPQPLSEEQNIVWYALGGCSSVLFAAGLGWVFDVGRRSADALTRASEARMRLVVANSQVEMLDVDFDGKIVLSAGNRFTGKEILADGSVSIFDVLADCDPEAIRGALEGKGCQFEARLNGRFFEVRLTPARGGATCLGVDLTERKELEAQMARSARMASLGTLAAGVGHEINNPLTYILANIEYLREELDVDEVDRESSIQALEHCMQGIEHIRRIVADLRVFSRPEDEKPAAVNIVPLLEEALALADHEIQGRARVHRAFESAAPVVGVPGPLKQVFVNLLVNAAQAIPDGAAEDNEIKVSSRRIDGITAIEISDTGIGIAPEIREHLFDPFFSTKAASGTGLGLSITHNIVSSMGGTIEVEAGPERGTCMRVCLPVAEDAKE